MEVLKTLRDPHGLEGCGPAVCFLLQQAVDCLASSRKDTLDAEAVAQTGDDLLQLAKDKITSYHYKDVPSCWRRLYTDATILYVFASSLSADFDDTDVVEDSVRRLDMAIIVAGAPGPGRSGAIFRLIRDCQSRLPADPESYEPSPKRRRTNGASKPAVAASPTSPPIVAPIPSLSPPPFLPSHCSSPFILRGFCSDWPASDPKTGWASEKYLRKVGGRARIVPVEVGRDYTEAGWGQRLVPWEHFLSSVFQISSEGGEDPEVLYLAQHDLFSQFPSLRNDLVLPDYLYSLPPAPTHMPKYKPPQNEDGFVTNAWLGPKGTVSPAHTDPYYNCYAQVVGKKYVWVAPPSSTSGMYAFTETKDPPSPSSGVEFADVNDPDTEGIFSALMTNTTRIDVISAMEHYPPSSSSKAQDEAARVTRSKFPRFFSDVAPASMQAVLEPGDLLFMPPGWWHSMKSLERSFSVSMWF